jgi:hypothetical protein
MIRRLFPILAVTAIAISPLGAKELPDNWDGLAKVEAKKLAAVYLLPQADFSGYSKVLIDRPEVAFHKDWKRDHNRSQRSLGGRVDDGDIRKAIDGATEYFVEALAKAYTKAGYQPVTEAGPDVLRVSTALVNISVDAPDLLSAGRSRTFSQQAGEATLVLEVRDSVSGALMGRAVDQKIAGDGGPYLRNNVTNRADFEQLFSRWAKISAEGLTKLKSMPR